MAGRRSGKAGTGAVDYNAVMLYEKGERESSLSKLHLVPFTEHFPYRKQFPFVYDALWFGYPLLEEGHRGDRHGRPPASNSPRRSA
jgi:apolipoprotein N-acyltransferase